MRSISRVLILTAVASAAGGVACSDDEQAPPVVPDAGQTTTRDAGEVSSSNSLDSSTSDEQLSTSSGVPSDVDDASLSTDASSSTELTDAGSGIVESSDGAAADAAATSAPVSMDGGANSGTDAAIELDAGDANSDGSVERDASDPPAEFSPPRGPCATADRIGRFIIESQESFGVVQGTFSNAVVPTAVPDVVVEDGTCRLDMRRTLSCVPACESGETCGEGGECVPYPARISVGEVKITGLTKPTELTPQNPGFIYLASGASNPPYTPGTEIILTASGSEETPGFDLFGVGSTPLSQEPNWVIEDGEDLAINWPSAGVDASTTVLVELTIDQHGTSPLSLACEFPDTGSAFVPATLIDQMLGAGVSGFPNGRITRRTADHVDVPLGCVELAVGSPRAASVTVAGYTPCHNTDDCPEGQTCNVPLERCED
jgi:hypothetical protein